mmetsp:Transcript_18625/g.36229  ORF Transcript_18625/g.36229 Transcript_18625/m.36229 type:complete len:239 (+) Transcript_18625:98-814(+)
MSAFQALDESGHSRVPLRTSGSVPNPDPPAFVQPAPVAIYPQIRSGPGSGAGEQSDLHVPLRMSDWPDMRQKLAPPLSHKGGRCTFPGCIRPEESWRFYRIKGSERHGGQDWAPVVGEVLCDACYRFFGRHGSLYSAYQRCKKRVRRHLDGEAEGEPGAAEKFTDARPGRRCTYIECPRPTESMKFYLIDGKGGAGGQDWSSLSGDVLCKACYVYFSNHGTLRRLHHPTQPKSRKLSG